MTASTMNDNSKQTLFKVEDYDWQEQEHEEERVQNKMSDKKSNIIQKKQKLSHKKILKTKGI